MVKYKYLKGELGYLKGFKNTIDLDTYAKMFPRCKEGVDSFINEYKMNRLTKKWEKKCEI